MISQQRALVRMPEVVGMPFKKAKLLIENAGLRVDGITFEESYERRDTVLQQKPTRGQMVYSGEQVALQVSRESYLKWLPTIYQRNDINGRNFFRDFLWIVQHVFTTIEEQLNDIHHLFDPYEAPEKFLPWLASWSAMLLEEDWPLEKKRRLVRKAVELYRIRGTVKGLKLFISLFTGHEPEIRENLWPFRGCRIGVTSSVGVDTLVLPPVNLAHTFVVEMPMSYIDLSPEAVIRIHEIIQKEKPASTEYYLRFAVEQRPAELREFYAIGTRSGIGLGQESSVPIESEVELQQFIEDERKKTEPPPSRSRAADDAKTPEEFGMPARKKRPILNAPKADQAPVEGQEIRSREAGFGASARQMDAVSTAELEAARSLMRTRESVKAMASPTVDMKAADKTVETKAPPPVPAKQPKDPKTKASAKDPASAKETEEKEPLASDTLPGNLTVEDVFGKKDPPGSGGKK